MATVTLSPQLRREICRAVAHGNPWISVGEVFAYTRLPVGKETVEDALKTLASTGVIRNRITEHGRRIYNPAEDLGAEVYE